MSTDRRHDKTRAAPRSPRPPYPPLRRGGGLLALTLVVTFANHVVMLDAGRVRASGPPSEALSPELVHLGWQVAATVLTRPVTGAPAITFDLPERTHP